MSDKSAWAKHARPFNEHGGIGGLTAEIDALRAENETLRGTCEWQLENDRKLTESIARLRTEVERLETGWSLDHERHKKADVEIERLRTVIRKHYPTIAGHVMRLQEAGEERAAAEWLAVAQDFAACQS